MLQYLKPRENGNEIEIPIFQTNEFITLEWREGEGWDEIKEKYSISNYDRLSQFMNEFEFLEHRDLRVYEIEEKGVFLISMADIEEFECIKDVICVRNHRFNYIEIFKRYWTLIKDSKQED